MNELFVTNFGAIDWVIAGVYLSVTLVIGIVANKAIHNASGYMIGGRATPTSLNVASYIGTGLGLVTLMYASIEAFSNGFAYLTLALIGAGTAFVLGSTGFAITRLRALKLTTIPEYFEKRFSRRTRVLGGTICAVAGIVNMGLFPKMGAMFIATATGLGGSSENPELMVNLITSALIVLVLVYTVMGGMVSVIVTDYLQFVVLSIGMALGIYFCLTHPDLGWGSITTAMAKHRGERMFNPVADGGYGWTWIGYNVLVFFAAYICWAPEASRALTAKDPDTARKTFLFSTPAKFASLAIPAFWAVAAFALVAQSPELTAHFFPDGLSGDAAGAAQAMPMILARIVPSGLLGLLVAGMMAAFMSTHDSYLLCWASVISRDVVSPLCKKPLDDKRQIKVARIAVVAIGLFLLVWGIWYELPKSVWTYMAVSGTVYLSGAAVSVIGGLYWKRASTTGATMALCGGTVAIAGLFTKQIAEATDLTVSPVQVGFFTFGLCIVLFVIGSLAFPDREATEPQEVSS